MGGRLSRVEVLSPELNRNHQYTYPPREGHQYFSSHYHLGSRKFETSDPEQFLFGELNDVNYMTTAPAAFPYKQPSRKKPVECLHSLLNLHKESIKLVRSPDNPSLYTIEFLFDSNVPCQISIFYSLLDISPMESLKHGITPSAITKVSQCFIYDKGLEQSFNQSSFIINPSNWAEEKLKYLPDSGQNLFPISILLETRSSDNDGYQSMLTVCNLEQSSTFNGAFGVKVLKQKMLIDNMEYLLHDIFGIENKYTPKDGEDEDNSDNDSDAESIDDELGAECVICYTDVRDTILLPCRHMCICASCAADLRYQASNCPICRSPFQALLQIQALQSIPPEERPDDDEVTDNPEIYSVAGFRTMSLIQALNGYPKIKHNKTQSSGGEIPLSTGDEDDEGEEEDDMTTNDPITASTRSPPPDTVIVLEMNGTVSHSTSQDHAPSDDLFPISESIECEVVPSAGRNGKANGDCVSSNEGRGEPLTITASIESGVSSDSPSSVTKQNEQQNRKSSNSTQSGGMSSWPSSNSINSSNSRDVLLLTEK